MLSERALKKKLKQQIVTCYEEVVMRKFLSYGPIEFSTKILPFALEIIRISIFRYGWPGQEICIAIDHDRKNNAKNYSR